MELVKKNLAIFLIVIIFLFLRLINLEESVNFGTDQGLAVLETYQLYQTKKLTLIGATGSSWTIEGRYIFFASYPYYLYLPVLLLFNWNPLSLSLLFISLNLLVLLFAYFIMMKYLKNRSLATIFSLIFTFFPIFVYHSQFVWSPNLLIILSTLLISLLIMISKSRNKFSILSFLTGFTAGIGLAIHFSFISAVILASVWLLIFGKFKRTTYFTFGAGLLTGIAPLAIFDFRHDFYNIKTAFFILALTKNISGSSVFNFNFHYILPIVPFIIYFVAKILVKAGKINRLIPLILLTIVIINSLITIMPPPSHGYNMTSGWNYKGVKKLANIIKEENKKGYNLVDLLTGDTRAMALRSLLQVTSNPPLGITDYQATDYLFVYSRDSIDKILSGTLWEIDSVRPVKLVDSWQIQNGVSLYLLARQKTESVLK